MKPVILIGVYHSDETLEAVKRKIDENAKSGDIIGLEADEFSSVKEAEE